MAIESSPSSAAGARDLLAYVDASPSPFHCVAESMRRLEAAGFQALAEQHRWTPSPGQRAYVQRGDGSLIAFRVGSSPPAEAGFRVVGAHTDSPNLRLKPRPGKHKEGYLLLDVDVYGGVLLATWTDRDLGIAGRIVVRRGESSTETRLVRLDRPVCRISNVAIHLNREVNEKGLVLNKHQHLSPVVAQWEVDGDPAAVVGTLLASAAGVERSEILGHDLCLFDLQVGAVVGQNDEFLAVARLDNQASCHAALTALVDAEDAQPTAVVALFDHEEVGSSSHRGADGPFLLDVLSRLAGGEPEAFPRAAARSSMVSADMAHAVHPNYADLHDVAHMPRLNAGPVIKTNYNQRYATDAESGAQFRRLCQLTGVPYQEFNNRPDLACGTTIGPISAARLGIRTVDVGNPMLSMHSIRELAGCHDVAYMARVLTAFLGGR